MSADLENQQPQDHHLIIENKGDNSSNHHHHHNSTSPYDPHHPITKIETDGDYVTFGNERYLRSDLVEAFGGTLNQG